MTFIRHSPSRQTRRRAFRSRCLRCDDDPRRACDSPFSFDSFSSVPRLRCLICEYWGGKRNLLFEVEKHFLIVLQIVTGGMGAFINWITLFYPRTFFVFLNYS